MADRIFLKYMAFTGPGKSPAVLSFGSELTMIWGASNTGKSFGLKALDFMFGGAKGLPDIEARVGYDEAWLALTLPKQGDITLNRSLRGGSFKVYQGHVLEPHQTKSPIKLRAKHDPSSMDNLSSVLLEELGLRGRVIATNAFGQKRSLSFRDLALSILVDETSIQSERSPIEGGQRGDRTTERSVFRLLVTGVDDSAVHTVDDPKVFKAAKLIRLEVIDGLIADLNAEIDQATEDKIELEKQLARLEHSTNEISRNYSKLQSSIGELVKEKHHLALSIPKVAARLDEVSLHIARFGQLQQMYTSDVHRLEALEEAGFVLGLASERACPLCGAEASAQAHNHDLEQAGIVREAAVAEISRIKKQSIDLEIAVGELLEERETLSEELPKLQARWGFLENEIGELSPIVESVQADLASNVVARDSVKRSLELLARREDLSRRRAGIEGAKPSKVADRPVLLAPSDATFQFAQKVGEVLREWGFPGLCHVSFDEDTFDLKIDGKARIANGKGVRAVTHAAFKVALLLFCRERGLPHPGFLVLDTPLLTYRDPLKSPRYGALEADEVALAETSLKDRFFRHLASLEADAQFIVLENVDPPSGLGAKARIEMFSGVDGRVGLFPAQI